MYRKSYSAILQVSIPWGFVQVVKRLYVGGLVHTVSETELQERFGKFGNVTETEIVTRKDEQGQPMKTFAYINITISENGLKKCISVLNKTKWKGGTLQIELAKESFLHRLARERQEASVKKAKPHSNGMTNVVESLKKSGVVDFHVKAVPGTEVRDHKDWVVGKFGRVLPILHLKSKWFVFLNSKNNIIKYDPSKYCHNLKKLNPDFSETVPISQLTWYLEEDDNQKSKKRQGQSPSAEKSPKKKRRVQESDSLNRTELNSYSQFSSKTTNVSPVKLSENHAPNIEKQNTKHSVDQKRRTGLTSSSTTSKLAENDIDSEEEIRAMIAREKEIGKVNSSIELEDDNMEVVRDDFELKYSTHWSLQKVCNAKNIHKRCDGELGTSENESDYDSAGTDEILAKIPNKKRGGNEVLEGSLTIREGTEGSSEKGILMRATSSGSVGVAKDKMKGGKRAVREKTNPMTASEHNCITNKCNSKDGESSDSFHDTSESEEDEDYETMMQNCYRLDLTLKDLERLAGEKMETSDEEADGNKSNAQCKTKESPISNIPKISRVNATAKKIICPEEIVSAILEEESSDEECSRKKRSHLKVQPFRGIGSLTINEMTTEKTKAELDMHESKDNQDSSYLVNVETLKNVTNSQHSDPTRNNFNCKSHLLGEINSESHENSDCSTHNSEDSEEDCSTMNVVSETNLANDLMPLSKRTKSEISSKGSDFVQTKNLKNSPLKNKKAFLDSAQAISTLDQKEKHLQDNMKRLAALQERQKEREVQKKLIQGALTNLEAQSTNKQKHIVFDSDAESEDEVQERTKEKSSGKLLEKEFSTKTSGKLFESSEEDESDTSSEEDDRFKIKPQFEGKAGEKLMHLQSRFGTDERFRMDTRFLESDSEQEDDSKKLEVDEEEDSLALEKKKNLEILKNLLHLNVEFPKPSKQAANVMKFRDINALRYDPTRQDHAVFEKKPEDTRKESKATKRKKREEAEKLPEVSKEIFYDVAVDLKEVLGSTKHHEKTATIPWDKHDATEPVTADDIETLTFSAGSNNREETSGFTFSFFGAENGTTPLKEDTYVIETIKPSRVAWQEDPRFQDSSSEEDDEPEVTEREDVKEMSPALPHSNDRFFFFTQDDNRLTEGPKLFCKSSNLDEDRDYWESRRQMLIEVRSLDDPPQQPIRVVTTLKEYHVLLANFFNNWTIFDY
ncbi:hypothetical protein lerEdw1_015790 [Lerista edwardsae]|nr:hypothetical protein lerEdw1_015790 [Lerista edwardsae]